MARTFYRIVVTDPPTADDFMSDAALDIPPRDDEPMTLHVHDGISVFATIAQARAKARRYPFLGAYIAELRFPDDRPRIERTFPNSRGHHTVWRDPDDALGSVVSVHPV